MSIGYEHEHELDFAQGAEEQKVLQQLRMPELTRQHVHIPHGKAGLAVNMLNASAFIQWVEIQSRVRSKAAKRIAQLWQKYKVCKTKPNLVRYNTGLNGGEAGISYLERVFSDPSKASKIRKAAIASSRKHLVRQLKSHLGSHLERHLGRPLESQLERFLS